MIRFLRRQGPAQGAESEDQKNKLLPPPPGCHDGPGSVGVKPGKELRSILLDECRHLTHPRRWQDGDPRQKTRTAGARKEKLLSCRRRAGLSSSGSRAVKNFCSLHGRCARRPKAGRAAGGGREGTIQKVRSVLLAADGLLMSRRESRQNGRMVGERGEAHDHLLCLPQPRFTMCVSHSAGS